MGWKNVKEHYGIAHIVHVRDNHIWVGSGYVPEIFGVRIDDLRIERKGHIGRGEPFDSFIAAMNADKFALRRLIDEPDTFVRSIPCFTYAMDRIIEKQCEAFGWPNVTHDGEIMYENTFSTNRKYMVQRALRNAKFGAESMRSHVAAAEHDLKKWRDYLAQYEAAEKTLSEMAS